MNTILLAPVNASCGISSIMDGFSYCLNCHGLHPKVLKPFIEKDDEQNSAAMTLEKATTLLSNQKEDELAQYIIKYIEDSRKNSDLVLIQGVSQKNHQLYASKLNTLIAKSLSAKVILLYFPGQNDLSIAKEHIELEANTFTNQGSEILGCILNKLGAPTDKDGNTRIDLFDPEEKLESATNFSIPNIPLIAAIPWNRSLMGIPIKEIAEHVNASILTQNYHNSNVYHFVLAAANMENISHIFEKEALVITSGDRSDIILASAIAFMQKKPVRGILLTGGYLPDENIMTLCKEAIDNGFPILSVPKDSLRLAIDLQNISARINKENKEEKIHRNEYICSFMDEKFLEELKTPFSSFTLSPAAFKYTLKKKASKNKQTIVLPEANDIRIIEAANICAKDQLANPILLGKKDDVIELAKANHIDLSEDIQIIDPKSIADSFVDKLVDLRKSKGLTKENAIEYLQDPIVVATMMLENNDVDGLVAGCITTTANVLSPALKILKTKPGVKKISSVFFMCLSSEVLLYADCAVNPNPTKEDLAEIAIQTAQTSKNFDIDPVVAMISYSTGTSGTGKDVEKVSEATQIIKEQNVDFPVDGPLQYDAAKSEEVAKIKAKESLVAGKASVFIFPDLNTANTTYKAVQQSGNALSIGPILQGIKKPVNDLSRGATVEDIVYTIVITAIQAQG